jgi:hypothetical protein
MTSGTWTLVIGGVIGAALILFGGGVLVTGRAPASTSRAFSTTRGAGLYHLLFGAALILLVTGTQMRGLANIITTVAAVLLAGVAIIKFRPRKKENP